MLQTIVGIDERSLAFWAVGHAKATGKPCAIICSSGTAVANFLPAVVEASMSSVPLIILTADRPSELRTTGAQQTIDQVRIYGNYVRYFEDIQAPSKDLPYEYVLNSIEHAYQISTNFRIPGPVHLNFQFREPLISDHKVERANSIGQKEHVSQNYKRWYFNRYCQTDTERLCVNLKENCFKNEQQSMIETILFQVKEYSKYIVAVASGLIIVGELVNSDDKFTLYKLSKLLGWPILSEIVSGDRFSSMDTTQNNKNAPRVTFMDQILLLDKQYWNHVQPQCILVFGEHIISKRLIQYLEYCQNNQFQDGTTSRIYKINAVLQKADAWSYQPIHISIAVKDFLLQIQEAACISKSKETRLQQRFNSFLVKLQRVVQANLLKEFNPRYNDKLTSQLLAFEISKNLPTSHQLFLGNSMVIRDFNSFGYHKQEQNSVQNIMGIRVGVNRGANGIDGILSSAEGFCQGIQAPTTLVIGDVSLLYDSNALNLLKESQYKYPLSIVINNNDGGEIFDYLPYAKEVDKEDFKRFWTTSHQTNFSHLCQAHGIPYQRVTDSSKLRKQLQGAWTSRHTNVVEVRTSSHQNINFNKYYQEKLKNSLEKCMQMFIQPIQLQNNCQVKSQSNEQSTESRQSCRDDIDTSEIGKCLYTYDNISNISLEIEALHVSQLSLILEKKLTTKHNSDIRQIQLLQLDVSAKCDEDNSYKVFGIGEVSPLEGFSLESTIDVLAQVELVKEFIIGKKIDFDIFLLDGQMQNQFLEWFGKDHVNLQPSLRFSIESALLDVLSKISNMNLRTMLLGQQSFYYNSQIQKYEIQRSSNLQLISKLLDKKDLHAKRWHEQQLNTQQMNLQYQNDSLQELLDQQEQRLPMQQKFMQEHQVNQLGQQYADSTYASKSYNISQCEIYQSLNFECEQHLKAYIKDSQAYVAYSYLVDNTPQYSQEDVLNQVQKGIELGHRCLKLKVGRRKNPIQDALIIQQVYRQYGQMVNIRADCNQLWTEQQAEIFYTYISDFGIQLEFIEEPNSCGLKSYISLYQKFGISFALDETIDVMGRDNIDLVQILVQLAAKSLQYNTENINMQKCPISGSISQKLGLKAVILKPSFLGGFERCLKIALEFANIGVYSIVSSLFESLIGIYYLQVLALNIQEICYQNIPNLKIIYHGLGTLNWFEHSSQFLDKVVSKQQACGVCFNVDKLSQWAKHFYDIQLNKFIQVRFSKEKSIVEVEGIQYYLHYIFTHQQIKLNQQQQGILKSTRYLLVFLHGFMGADIEWMPYAKYMVSSFGIDSIAVNLHFRVQNQNAGQSSLNYSIQNQARIVFEFLLQLQYDKIIIVGYSMGGRVAIEISKLFQNQEKQMLTHLILISCAVDLSRYHQLNDQKLQNSQQQEKQKESFQVQKQNQEIQLQQQKQQEKFQQQQQSQYLQFQQRISQWQSQQQCYSQAQQQNSQIKQFKQQTQVQFTNLHEKRLFRDLQLSNLLLQIDIINFQKVWYQSKIWGNLLKHPIYNYYQEQRKKNHATENYQFYLARQIFEASSGHLSQQGDLEGLRQVPNLLYIAGAQDKKFCTTGSNLINLLNKDKTDAFERQLYIVEDCGHACQIEAPFTITKIINGFLLKSL